MSGEVGVPWASHMRRRHRTGKFLFLDKYWLAPVWAMMLFPDSAFVVYVVHQPGLGAGQNLYLRHTSTYSSYTWYRLYLHLQYPITPIPQYPKTPIPIPISPLPPAIAMPNTQTIPVRVSPASRQHLLGLLLPSQLNRFKDEPQCDHGRVGVGDVHFS